MALIPRRTVHHPLSTADHIPSRSRPRLTSSRWVWRCGSPDALARCSNAAATIPSLGANPPGTPDRRNRNSLLSKSATTPSTAARWEAATRSAASPAPAPSSDTDFGAARVRSHPALRRVGLRAGRKCPSPGSHPCRTATSARRSTAPDNPSASVPPPTHRPDPWSRK